MKKKLFLIEDNRFICEVYKDSLEKAGFLVMLAYDGEEALRRVEKERPDLILLDLALPKLNGFEVLKKIKENKNLKNIPVIILSNYDEGEDIKKGKELGAIDYLVKARFSPKEVIEKVKTYLFKSLNEN